MTIEMQEILQLCFDRGASDLHLKTTQPPILRVAGKLIRTDFDPLNKDDVQRLVFSILTPEQRRTLEQTYELDCSYGVEGLGRFRVNVYKDRGNYAAALRTIQSRVPSIDDLGLPPVVKEIAHKPRGMVLVTGPTGSGKSTTLASMIDWINENRSEHILTIEDPIEFVHPNKKSVVSQRELGADTKSFANALRAALREDPDIILVGEMRDLETIQLALTAAETGHLVFGTLHTSSAAQTIDRVVDVFPPSQQQQVRVMLSNGLVAVLSQTLLPRASQQAGGSQTTKGRVLAVEVMLNTPAIANLIRESKTAQIYSAIQMGGAQGMQTLESCLAQLVKNSLVNFDDALTKSSRPEDFQRMVGPQLALSGAGQGRH
ncbi:MAG: type IV pilus twitching motility protein PilT [Candidatus Melainabacteria bacterium]|nr:type IV pilus twitching motility protein PilT [Candidatus Melainabacteria bacterium]